MFPTPRRTGAHLVKSRVDSADFRQPAIWHVTHRVCGCQNRHSLQEKEPAVSVGVPGRILPRARGSGLGAATTDGSLDTGREALAGRRRDWGNGERQVLHCDHGWEWDREPGRWLDKLRFEPRPTGPGTFAPSIEPNGALQSSPFLESRNAILSPFCSPGSLCLGFTSTPHSCPSGWLAVGSSWWLYGFLLPTQLTFNLSGQNSPILIFNLRKLKKYILWKPNISFCENESFSSYANENEGE